MKQVAEAKPRQLKLELGLNDIVQFDAEEIVIVGHSMIRYLTNINESICQQWQKA
jgi:hypothetical protein